jgi:hypothetical protein
MQSWMDALLATNSTDNPVPKLTPMIIAAAMTSRVCLASCAGAGISYRICYGRRFRSVGGAGFSSNSGLYPAVAQLRRSHPMAPRQRKRDPVAPALSATVGQKRGDARSGGCLVHSFRKSFFSGAICLRDRSWPYDSPRAGRLTLTVKSLSAGLSRPKRDRCRLTDDGLDQRDGEENCDQDAVPQYTAGWWNGKAGAIGQQVLHAGRKSPSDLETSTQPLRFML